MDITRIYGMAQLTRTLDNDTLNVVLYQQCGCTKSKMIKEYLQSLAGDGQYDGINVLLVDSQRLPDDYYRRRGIDRFPVVSYCHGKHEINRVTGYHDLDMLIRGITTSRLKLTA